MIEKVESSFPRNNSKKDKLGCHCKDCHKQYTKAHYEKNKKYYLNKAKKNTARYAKEITKLKAQPCTDCKQSYPYYVMDFDHVTGEKFANVSSLQAAGQLKKAKEEIGKCELVCANCHRIRTYKRAHSLMD